MEESINHQHHNNSTLSQWKLKQKMLQNHRNFRQLENRLLILQHEKQKKIKSIEKQLDRHKKIVEVKVGKFKLKQDIQHSQNSWLQQEGINSRIFREIRLDRINNIHQKNENVVSQKNQLFKEIKKQREVNEKLMKEKASRELLLKTEKRNRVRLIEIESRQNVTDYWNNRIEGFQEMRRQEMDKKLHQHEQNILRLMKMEKTELDLLAQLQKAGDMEHNLDNLIIEERSMDGEILSQIYSSHRE